MSKRQTLIEQLRGASQLAVEATRNVTDLVQAMHLTIGGGPAFLGKPLHGITNLLSAPTYAAVRGVTSVVGHGIDAALGALAPIVERSGAEEGAVLAALNGVLGDYLVETNNPLALKLELRSGGRALTLTSEGLAGCEGERVLVLVHGSSMNDAQWLRHGHDHGAALARSRGLTPVYVRYNSGLHVSENGQALSTALEALVQHWPRPVTELVLVGHSMGGLVSRSACLAGEAHGATWRQRLRVLVTLGTPHHGAPLERAGSWLELLLQGNPYSAPLAKLGRLRSAGVTDLRYGNVLEAHWAGRERFGPHDDPREALSLPTGVKCYAVAATLSAPGATVQLGDGLVPIESALGQLPAHPLRFDDTFVLEGASHLDLLDRPEVFAKLDRWLSA